MSSERVPLRTLLLFSLPTIPTVLLLAPLGAVLPAFYAEHTAATLASIGGVLVLARVLDAITDPLIGYFSDSTKSRLGPRKPWMIAGTILTLICVRPLFAPPEDASASYFLVWSACAYLAWTVIFIPYNAWASELSGNYNERSRVFAYRNMVGGIGGILFAVGPLLFSRFTGSTEMNAAALNIIGWIVMVLMPLCVLLVVVWGPERKQVSLQEGSFTGLFKALQSNRLLWFFMAITVLAGLTIGIQMSTSFLVLNYLQLGPQFPYIAGAAMLAGVGSLPIWLRVTYRFGKHRPWAVSLFSQVVLLPVMLSLEPGPSAFVPFLILVVFTNVMGACVLVSAAAMLSDIVDYDILKTGVNRSANYFAFLGLVGKLNTALSGGLGFYIAASFGYDAKVQNSPDEALGLIIAFAGIPAVLGVIAGSLMWRYPLNARKHQIVRKRIEQLAKRAAATSAVPS